VVRTTGPPTHFRQSAKRKESSETSRLADFQGSLRFSARLPGDTLPFFQPVPASDNLPMSQQIHLDSPHSLSNLLRSALVRSPYFGGRSLEVEVNDDSVIVSGVVQTYYQKQMVQESLRPYLGNSRLQNRLEVASWGASRPGVACG